MTLKEFYDLSKDMKYLELTFKARDDMERRFIVALYDLGMRVTKSNFKDYLNLKLKNVIDDGYGPLYDEPIVDVIKKDLMDESEFKKEYATLLHTSGEKELSQELVFSLSSYIFYLTISGKGYEECILTYRKLENDGTFENLIFNAQSNETCINDDLRYTINNLKSVRLERCKEECEEVTLTRNEEHVTSFEKIIDNSKEKEFSSNKSLNNKRVLGITDEFRSVSKRTPVERRTIIAKIVETGVASTIRYSDTNVNNIPSIWVLDSNKNKGIHIENKYKKKFHKNEILGKTVRLDSRFNKYREIVEGR